MITQIGIVAGEIWDYLENHDKSALMEDVVGGLGKDRDIVLMSMGWLAREGHITLNGEGPNCIVRLTNEKEK